MKQPVAGQMAEERSAVKQGDVEQEGVERQRVLRRVLESPGWVAV